jgi:hypothetical protein
VVSVPLMQINWNPCAVYGCSNGGQLVLSLSIEPAQLNEPIEVRRYLCLDHIRDSRELDGLRGQLYEIIRREPKIPPNRGGP